MIATTYEPSCPHRGTLLWKEKGRICGRRNETAKIYACNLRQKCTVLQYGIINDDGTTIQVCLKCPDLPLPSG